MLHIVLVTPNFKALKKNKRHTSCVHLQFLAQGRQRKNGNEFKVSLGYKVRPCLGKRQKSFNK